MRWWRRLGHRLRYPIFGTLFVGRMVDWFMGNPSWRDEEERIQEDFWIECPSCKERVAIERG